MHVKRIIESWGMTQTEFAKRMGTTDKTLRVTVPGRDTATIDVPDNDKLIWLSQTTLSVDETISTVDVLKDRFPQLVSPPSDDICYATQNRQAAVKAIAERCDVVIVVGSGNSSNSVRLVEVALECGARSAFRVDCVDELDEAWFAGVGTVGVSSGASVPEILVNDVLVWLAERGFGDVDEVETAEETLVFSLPPELRRDLKAARSAQA